MIKVENVTKRFANVTALSKISCTIPEGCIYGLVGSNGAGKSTFMRILTGIYKPDEGTVTIDGKAVFENPETKSRFAYVPDELYFLPQATMNRMAKLYSRVYKTFSYDRFHELTNLFGLDPKANINSFSKGMKRQAATILALSTMPEYIFFDETFDGLDPVMRNFVKQAIYSDVCDRSCTAVISSHSLRELEDTCDQLALLHKGGIIFESDIDKLKTSLFKVQVSFDTDFDKDTFKGIDIVSFSKKGSVATLIIRGEREKTMAILQQLNPKLLDVLPLTLEEVFTYEMDALGYSFKYTL